MAISVCFHFTLFVAALYISYQGVSGQGLGCATNAATCWTTLTTSGDKEEICKSVETTFNCIENAMKPCGGLSGDILAKAREQVVKYGCSAPGLPAVSLPGSAPGLPAVSALCLLMAALFHMLL
uniref:Uncharacterized protein LOC111123757 n=1 Tax=Crassostrea virginica TaxID=6565 RepID=A0A8B8D1S6_CRAVI|nr:uncharacterized protein LOC111123757 [Crassostrea virginica]